MRHLIGCTALAAMLGLGMMCLGGCKKEQPKATPAPAGAKADDAKKGADTPATKPGDATKKAEEPTKKGG